MFQEFSFPDVVEDVVDRAGGQQATAEDVERIRRSIRIVLERWLASGYNTWRHETHTVHANGVTPEIKLPRTVDDVIHVGVERELGASTLERISPQQYAQLGKRDRPGEPSCYWLKRDVDCPKLMIYPMGVQGEAARLRVSFISRPDSFERTGENDDIPGRWLEALVTSVAHDFACKRPATGGTYDEALIARLDGQRREAEDTARRADRNRVRYRYRPAV